MPSENTVSPERSRSPVTILELYLESNIMLFAQPYDIGASHEGMQVNLGAYESARVVSTAC